jgi:hypothetical protein
MAEIDAWTGSPRRANLSPHACAILSPDAEVSHPCRTLSSRTRGRACHDRRVAHELHVPTLKEDPAEAEIASHRCCSEPA